ncbi:MAG: translation initiation factor IF-3 [Candidatus Margulisbacteria bacterium]|nr:translation initiation factor IF-3 [Candidatus Margulisiibacteriota bacterium]
MFESIIDTRRPFIKDYTLNEKIRVPEVRLIGDDGNQLGVVKIEEAKRLAEEKGLDLLLVSKEAKPPVCRIVEFGQYRHEQQKKEKKAKKGVRNYVLKELKMSPKISDHDYTVRVNLGRKFLTKGFNVKLTIFFKGREAAHPELGQTLLTRYLEDMKEFCSTNGDISRTRRMITAIITPSKGQ